MIELTDNLTKSVIKLAEEAGRAILQIYAGPINVTVKGDSSPLTQADQLAHSILTAGLSTLTPQLPVISEESSAEEQARRPELACYWLIDPLDGTKEFIQRNGEFTVNIALIEQGVSRFGVVHVPVSGNTYWGGADVGAWRKDGTGEQAIKVAKPAAGEPLTVVGSRSHLNTETENFLSSLGPYELVSVGSSLKFCLLAEGKAHIYPRLAPTCEWDTAAAQAVLEGAGGSVCALDGSPLRYSKPEILNPWFVARSVQADELSA